MIENAYVFYNPQYGGLRVVRNDEGLFFCIEDLVAITDIGRDKLFTVLADTEGKVSKCVCGRAKQKGTEGY